MKYIINIWRALRHWHCNKFVGHRFLTHYDGDFAEDRQIFHGKLACIYCGKTLRSFREDKDEK